MSFRFPAREPRSTSDRSVVVTKRRVAPSSASRAVRPPRLSAGARRLRGLPLLAACLPALLAPAAGGAQSAGPLRKLGEMRVTLVGLAATVDPLNPVVPKNVASGVRIAVRAGGRDLTAAEVRQLLGGPFQVHGELSGPGLGGTLALPQAGPGTVPSPDPLVLTFPGLPQAGDYDLANLRIVRDGRIALDVTPRRVTVRVIEQILVSSVQTRPLTLDEIRQRGILLDSSSYLGFEFTVGMKIESTAVDFKFPVVFDREGAPLPLPLQPPPELPRTGVTARAPALVPVMMKPVADGPGGGDLPPLALPDGTPVRIPSLLLIPGNVGYLKQFFSAKLFVANGAPQGSGLVVHNVRAKIKLPEAPDGGIPPLTLPATRNGPQPTTLPVLREDGTGALQAGEQGSAEFTLRGEQEGFHAVQFDLDADLDGLPTGTVSIRGKAKGGVLVRNAYLDMTFTLPSVVREGEEFTVFVNVTNIGQGTGNLVKVKLDGVSGALPVGPEEQTIDELPPGDSRTLEFRFESEATGQVTASYLRFDTQGGNASVTGRLRFTLGVGDRGVPLSPDTLVLPTSVDALPAETAPVVRAAMRVLGQAWSVATAPTLPAGVLPTTRAVVTQKALALAEAGLRVQLRGGSAAAVRDALRDVWLDFHGGQEALDPGFDQVLRHTRAGQAFDTVLAALLAEAAQHEGGALPYEEQIAELASSGAPFVSFAVAGDGNAELPAAVSVFDAAGRRSDAGALRELPGASVVRPGGGPEAPVLGFVARPSPGATTLQINGLADGAVDVSLTVPESGGGARRAAVTNLAVSALSRARFVYDPARPEPLVLEQDQDGDGVYESSEVPPSSSVSSPGPRLLAAQTIGPETLDGANPFGVYAVLLFDRVVSAAAASQKRNYEIEKNEVLAARRQLSGRLVFAALAQPEGPLAPQNVAVKQMKDERGRGGARQEVALGSRIEVPGALVNGRVLQADGTPVPGVTVHYGNAWSPECTPYARPGGVAALKTDDYGFFELRFVTQDHCGSPFLLSARDPQTGALRSVNGWVRAHGERQVRDLVLIGRGSVHGTVRRPDGSPAGGARVHVASVTDPQVAGVATADAAGEYLVRDITVGPVVVTAALGVNLGSGAGRIEAAGTSAVVDVFLDGNVSVHGVVRKLENGVLSEVPGVQVLYYRGPLLVGVTLTDHAGRYALEGLPAGLFRIEAALNTRDKTAIWGDAAAGAVLPRDLVIVVEPDANHGSVSGQVRLPNGSGAAHALVYADDGRSVAADANGDYLLTGMPVSPAPQTVRAVSADGRRQGHVRVTIQQPGHEVRDAVITLSGLGTAAFYVIDENDEPVPGQTVGLQGACQHPCGCRFAVTDGGGRAVFHDLPLGGAWAQVVRVQPDRVDAALGSATISSESTAGIGYLKLGGFGRISGTVLEPDGQPAHGADVAVSSLKYQNDGATTCGLVHTVSHRGATDTQGRYSFEGVHVGPVQVSVSRFDYPTPVGTQGTLTQAGIELPLPTLRLVDTVAGEITGRVFLPGGETPVGAGVEVGASGGSIPEVKVQTDGDGFYRFRRVLPAGSYALTARDTRSGGTGSLAQKRVVLAAGQNAQYDLTLKARGPVTVKVVDGNSQPVSAAFVRLAESEFPKRTYERSFSGSSTGQVEFPLVFSGPLSVEASDAVGRGGRAPATLPPDGHPIEVTVRLTTTGTVAGRFYMPDQNTPIPLGTVRLVAGGRVIGQATTGSTGDEVGAYRFDYVPAGELRLEAEDPRTGRTGVAVGTLTTEGETVTLHVYAQGVGRVEGVVTLNGAPHASANVEVVSGRYRVQVLSDGAGRYAVDGVPEGRVQAGADLGGQFLRGTAEGTLVGDGGTLTLDIPLRGAGSIDGYLRAADGVSVAPVSLVTLTATGSAQSVTSDPLTGRFRFDLVPEGTVTLTADALSNSDRAWARYTVTAGETLPVTLVLNGLGSLQGTIEDENGPVSGDLVVSGMGAHYYVFVLQPTGTFALPEVPAGPFTARLTVKRSGLWLYGTVSDTLQPGEQKTIRIVVEPSGSVRGVVLRSNGTPAVGARAVLQTFDGRYVTTQVQGDGTLLIQGVPAGVFALKIDDPITGGLGHVLGRTVVAGLETDVGVITLDDTPVAVAAVDPPDGATGIAVTQPVRVTFSDPLLHPGGVGLRSNGQIVGSVASLSADGYTVTLSGTWPDARELTVEASQYVTDVFGRHPSGVFQSRFRTVDLSPPKVVALVPAANAIQVPLASVVRVSFDEPLLETAGFANVVRLTGPAGALAGAVTLTGPAELTFTPAAPLASDATYTVTVNGAVDISGNTQTVVFTASFKTLDTLAPALTLYTPAGAWTTAVRPLIRVSAADATSGIDGASATLRVDDQPVAATVAGGFIQFTPASDLAQGAHALSASIADLAGNVGYFTGGFGVDSVPPGPALLSGVGDGDVVSGTRALSATATDATSGLARVDFMRNGVQFASATAAQGLSTPWNTAGVSDGEYLLAARAVDAAGNVGPVGAALRVVVNNKPVTVTITEPAAGVVLRDQVTIKATVNEPVLRVEFSAGAAPPVADDASPYEATFDLGTFPDGNATLTATAIGLAPGETATAGRTVVVDRTPPAAPDVARVGAESDGSSTLVLGQPGAVEAGARVEALNLDTGATGFTAAAAADGSFALRVDGVIGQTLALTAVDAAGNRSVASNLVIAEQVTQEGVPLAGLRLWVQSDQDVVADASGRVSEWGDQSGNGNHLLQGTAAARPLVVTDAVAGKPVLRFDGVDDFLQFTARLTGVRTVFLVLKGSSSGSYRWLLGDSSTSPFAPGFTTLWSSSSAAASVLNGETWLNDAAVDGQLTSRPAQMSVLSVVTTDPVAADRLFRQPNGTPWLGDVAELLVYETVLSGGDRKAVQDYLARKYGLYVPQVVAPTITPNGGLITGSTTVTLATRTPGAVITYTLDGSEPTAASTPYTQPFTIDATTTVKAKAFRDAHPESTTAVAGFVRTEENSPAHFAGLALWVRADAGVVADAAGRVAAWKDVRDGASGSVIQPSTPAQPTVVRNAQNGLPVLRFDGGDWMHFAPAQPELHTVFFVVSGSTSPNYQFLLGDGVPNGNPLSPFYGGYDKIWLGAPYTSAQVLGGQTWLNGVPVDGTGTLRPTQMSVLSVITTGKVPVTELFAQHNAAWQFVNSRWKGDLAELIVYTRALTGGERQAVEDYLAQKYRLAAYPARVSAPEFSPNGGRFEGSQSVSLSTRTPGASIRYTIDGSEPTDSSSLYVEPLVLSTTATIKARAFRWDLQPSASATVSFIEDSDFTPADVSGLAFWGRADAGVATNATRVAEWTSQVGSAKLIQADGTAMPALVPAAGTGQPVLRFDGDDWMRFVPAQPKLHTVFFVLSGSLSPAYQFLLGDGVEGTDPASAFYGGYDKIWAGTPYTSSRVLGGQTWLNGVPVDGTGTLRPTQMSVLSVVTTHEVPVTELFAQHDNAWKLVNKPWKGDLAELLVYTRALSGAERKAVEDYLVLKHRPAAYPARASAPEFTPNGGSFSGSLTLSLRSATPGAEIRYTTDGSEPGAASALYAEPLTVSATTTVKAAAFHASLLPSATTTAAFLDDAGFTPADLGGLALWLRADAGVSREAGERVAEWRDQTPRAQNVPGNDARMGRALDLPVLTMLSPSGRPALRFDGAGDHLLFTQRVTDVRSVFWVLRSVPPPPPDWPRSYQFLLGDSSGNPFYPGYATLWLGTSPSPTSPMVINGQTRLNGVVVNGTQTARPTSLSVLSLVTTGPVGADRMCVQHNSNGAVVGSSWEGDVGELIVYNRDLSLSEVKQVEQYLGARYGIVVQP